MGVTFLVVGYGMEIFNIKLIINSSWKKIVYSIIWNYFRVIAYSDSQYFND